MISIEVTQESQTALRVRMDQAQTGVKGGLRAGIWAATIRLSTVIKRDYLSGQVVNRRSGNLSRAVVPKMIDDSTGVVVVGKEAPYGRFINDGTAQHLITAHGAIIAAAGRAGLDVEGLSGPKALRFVMNGKTMFRKSVMHPGIKARHFMEDALAASRVDIQRIIESRVNRGLQGKSVE